jgi:flavin reductase (DIM6/NTAB) family NADH-FMN oxidoreductase RutF
MNKPTPAVAIDAATFKAALSHASTAVTVVTTNGPYGRAGVTCSAITSVCDDPPTVLLCLNRNGYAAGLLRKNGILAVNWLAAEHADVSQVFAGVGSVPMESRFLGAEWSQSTTAAPSHIDALISFDCSISHVVDVGSHCVVFAHVHGANYRQDGQPLIYHRRQYTTTIDHLHL